MRSSAVRAIIQRMKIQKAFTPDFNGERFDSGIIELDFLGSVYVSDGDPRVVLSAFPHLDANIDLGALAAYDDGNHADA